MANLDIGLVGYGEVGKIFSNGLKAKGLNWLGAWDIIFGDAMFGDAQRLHAQAHGVMACESASHVCTKANLIVSAVTASNTLAVAQEIARFIRPGTMFLDMNSASRSTKLAASRLIKDADAHYRDDERHVSLHRLGAAGCLFFQSRRATRQAPRRGNVRGRKHGE